MVGVYGGEHRRSRGGRAGLAVACAVLSLLVHGGAAVGVVALQGLLPEPSVTGVSSHAEEPPKVRLLRVAPAAEPEKPLAFAKTDPDRPQESPEKPDFIGARDARAASDPHAYANRSEEHAPAMEGLEDRQELNTVEQERQDGFIGSEAGAASAEPPSPPSPQPTAEAEEKRSPDAPSGAPERPAEQQPTAPEEKSHDGEAEEPSEQGETEQTKVGEVPVPTSAPAPEKVYYDPTLTPAAQPGFRTHERKSRSTGSFVVGRGASLNVSRTPMGLYQAHLYRLIAAHWYAQCDEHRGDIIPGSITFSIRLNRRGRIVNMDLVRRTGAGVLQQNFTLLAIRQTSPPPMPEEVQREMVGDLLELYFTFIFY